MNVIFSIAIFFCAVVIHEFAHGFVAYKRGDPTAKRMGRLTLNPLAHIDVFGTILLPVFLILAGSPVLFGWAKPVPVNFAGLKSPKRDMIWVALAGPAANLALAFLSSVILKAHLFGVHSAAGAIVSDFCVINVVLAVFNLLPIPPLDGSRVVMGILPEPLALRAAALEPYGFLVLFILLYAGLFAKFIRPIANLILEFLMR